jgi:hypothetical protein
MDRESRRAACDEIRRRLDAAIAVLSRHDELSSLVERLRQIRGLAMLQARHRETPGDGTGQPARGGTNERDGGGEPHRNG